MPKQVQITPEVRAVLERAETRGNMLILNQPGLPRPLYGAVDKVLRALGGKWERGPQAHVFNGAADRLLADALGSGVAVDQKRTQQQFFTPPAVADMLWERVRPRRGEHVLEPSAGEGALLAVPIRVGCLITAVERDEALARKLITILPQHGGGIWLGDFLEWKPSAAAPIDIVAMNPPFDRGLDIQHVTRAIGILRPGGRLVAIMSPGWTTNQNRAATEFRDLVASCDGHWHPLPPDSFKSAGTNVNTGILALRKGE